MKNKCGIFLRLLIVIIFCIGSIVGLSVCSDNKGNEDIDSPNQEIPSDPSLDTIFDSDGTGADTNGLTYQKFISRSKKYKIAWIIGYNGSDYANVVIPETVDKGYTVTKIGEKAFENSNISSVIMPSQLEEIGSYAFRNCQFLQEINLGEVVSIENHAFNKCILLILFARRLYCAASISSARCIKFNSFAAPARANPPRKYLDINIIILRGILNK